jgi:dethiobiotin synthetase
VNASFSCFVTGTDTEIGKTLVSSALLHALAQAGVRAAAIKSVAAGAHAVQTADGEVWHNDDADALAQANPMSICQWNSTVPYLLREPLLRRTLWRSWKNVAIDIGHIRRTYEQRSLAQSDAVVVEGVGGFCVPLNGWRRYRRFGATTGFAGHNGGRAAAWDALTMRC